MLANSTPQYDVIIIGAGPAGLSFARSLSGHGLKTAIVEQQSQATLANPPEDGREIALTHASKDLLQTLGAWDVLSDDLKYPLRDAKVINGNSPYVLHFPTPKAARGKSIENLGYLIANHDIRRSLYHVCQPCSDLDFYTDEVVEQASSQANIAQVKLASGQILTSRLLVAADSRFSNTRRQMGIAADLHDFGRTVIVFRMQHTLSNEHTASECFYYGRTLAILPLTEQRSSIVITLNSSQAEAFLTQTPEALAKDIMGQLNGQLGEMHLVGERHIYPLVGVHANRFYAQRFALIGDAAVGMHPVTAHGFNLGLASQQTLADLVIKAHKTDEDIASPALLARYQRQHRTRTIPLYYGTNAIVKLFTSENPVSKILRHTALHAGNHLPLFKQLVSKQLTG